MTQHNQTSAETCETCFRIQCRQCQWIAGKEDVIMIQLGKLTACPQCGWQPANLQ